MYGMKMSKTTPAFEKLIIDFNSFETHVLILILVTWKTTDQGKHLGGSEDQAFLTKWN